MIEQLAQQIQELCMNGASQSDIIHFFENNFISKNASATEVCASIPSIFEYVKQIENELKELKLENKRLKESMSGDRVEISVLKSQLNKERVII